jgi:hypothetical protein
MCIIELRREGTRAKRQKKRSRWQKLFHRVGAS